MRAAISVKGNFCQFLCTFTSADIGENANLELVDKLCYLGDMLSVNRDADAAMETRI